MSRLQIEPIMKNYLTSITNEMKDYYSKFINQVKYTQENFTDIVEDLCDSVVALLDYYTEPIINSGKKVISKKLEKTEFIQDDLINKYKNDKLNEFGELLKIAILGSFKDKENDNEFFEELEEIVVDFCIKMFKHAQLLECKNNNIEEISLVSDNDISCKKCQTLAKFKQNVNDLIKNIDNLHSFCKLSIDINSEEIINDVLMVNGIDFMSIPKNYVKKVQNTILTLRMYLPDLITEKTYRFTKNIVEVDSFLSLLKIKYNPDELSEIINIINNKLEFFENESEILISEKFNNIEYILTKTLLRDKLLEQNFDWWKEDFYEKLKSKSIGEKVSAYEKQFVNYIAEQNTDSYFIESAVYYILNPKLLKEIDKENYLRLKDFIFKGVEFLRG